MARTKTELLNQVETIKQTFRERHSIEMPEALIVQVLGELLQTKMTKYLTSIYGEHTIEELHTITSELFERQQKEAEAESQRVVERIQAKMTQIKAKASQDEQPDKKRKPEKH